MAMLLDPEFHRSAWPLEAGGLFIDYLFSAFTFHKVYAEVIDFNFAQFGSIARQGPFREEARLADHIYADGRYWDLRILAAYRTDWARRGQTPLGRFFARRRMA
jgi:RimJ/RimL family protein N-acetyltransferase